MTLQEQVSILKQQVEAMQKAIKELREQVNGDGWGGP